MKRFKIKDSAFAELDVSIGNNIYLFQGDDADKEQAMISLTQEGAYQLGLELVRRCLPKNGGSVQ